MTCINLLRHQACIAQHLINDVRWRVDHGIGTTKIARSKYRNWMNYHRTTILDGEDPTGSFRCYCVGLMRHAYQIDNQLVEYGCVEEFIPDAWWKT